MKNQGISRRRFFALCGGEVTGIWLAGRGLIRLPAQMVFAMSGSCSFCSRKGDETFGLAGVTHLNIRICDECLDLCCDILTAMDVEPPTPAPVEEASGIPDEVCGDAQLLDELFHRGEAGEHDDPLINAIAAALTQAKASGVFPPRRLEDPACSFCAKSESEVTKLIAGPTDYICDGCIRDARVLFMGYGWRPLG